METHNLSQRLTKQIQREAELLSLLHSNSVESISRELMRTFDFQVFPFQRLLDAAERATSFYQQINSINDEIRKRLVSVDAFASAAQRAFSNFDLSNSAFQKLIDAFDASTKTSALHDKIISAASAFNHLQSRLGFQNISRVIDSSFAVQRAMESVSVSRLAERIIKEAEFQSAFLERLTAELDAPVHAPETLQDDGKRLLEEVERAITNSGAGTQAEDACSTVASLFAQWEKLPQDLRTLIMGLFVAIFGALFAHSLEAGKQAQTISQQIKIVQKITNQVYMDSDRRSLPQLAIVTKNKLAVFKSHRRDSCRVAWLHAAQVVIVKMQKRNWTFVEWIDPSTKKSGMGWVFTRYLKKL